MARYKDYCCEQSKMIPISFREQILPGTFEHTLSHLIDHELDLSDRFTLRGRRKVDAQWKLYCMVHNMLKIHRYDAHFG